MTVAAFSAWQVLGAKGLKKSWPSYKKDLGLDDKKAQIDKKEKEDIIDSAKNLLKKMR